jgi:hypothetical protein
VTSTPAPDPNELEPLAAVPPPLRPWNLTRVFAAIAGGAILVMAAFFTAGLVLLAPLGMIGARYLARRQNSNFTIATSWLGAAIFVEFALAGIAIVALLQTPRTTLDTFKRATDSASVNSKRRPPPAWLERIAPGTTARARVAPSTSPTFNRALLIWTFVVGGVITATLGAVVIGTAGWLPSLLLSYAFSGRWIPRS